MLKIIIYDNLSETSNTNETFRPPRMGEIFTTHGTEALFPCIEHMQTGCCVYEPILPSRHLDDLGMKSEMVSLLHCRTLGGANFAIPFIEPDIKYEEDYYRPLALACDEQQPTVFKLFHCNETNKLAIETLGFSTEEPMDEQWLPDIVRKLLAERLLVTKSEF